MHQQRHPQRIVPHQLRGSCFPRHITEGERVYLISNQHLQGWCSIRRFDVESRLLSLENWIIPWEEFSQLYPQIISTINELIDVLEE